MREKLKINKGDSLNIVTDKKSILLKIENMENIGMSRKIDKVGRVVIPKELRESLNIKEQEMEICIRGKTIILKKYNKKCVICNSKTNLKEFEDTFLCLKCIQKIKSTDFIEMNY